MNERGVGSVQAIFQGAFVINGPFERAANHLEVGVVKVGQIGQGRPFRFGQIAQEGPDVAVLFHRRVSVHAGFLRHGQVWVGGNFDAGAVRLVLPAVIGADYAIPLHPTIRQRPAAMDA